MNTKSFVTFEPSYIFRHQTVRRWIASSKNINAPDQLGRRWRSLCPSPCPLSDGTARSRRISLPVPRFKKYRDKLKNLKYRIAIRYGVERCRGRGKFDNRLWCAFIREEEPNAAARDVGPTRQFGWVP